MLITVIPQFTTKYPKNHANITNKNTDSENSLKFLSDSFGPQVISSRNVQNKWLYFKTIKNSLKKKSLCVVMPSTGCTIKYSRFILLFIKFTLISFYKYAEKLHNTKVKPTKQCILAKSGLPSCPSHSVYSHICTFF